MRCCSGMTHATPTSATGSTACCGTGTSRASHRSTRSCRAATPSGRGCGSTTAGSYGLDEHLARLRRSARALGFDAVPADDEIVAAVRATLAANDMRDGVHVRLTLTRGVKVTSGMDPRLNQAGRTLIVLAEHKPPVYDTGGLTLATASVRRPGAGRARPEDPPQQPDQLDPGQDRGERRRRRRRDDARRPRLRRRDQRDPPVRGRRRRARHAARGRLPGGHHPGHRARLRPARARRAGRATSSQAEMYTADEVFCTGTMGEIAGVWRSTAGRSATARSARSPARLARGLPGNTPASTLRGCGRTAPS